MKHVGTEMISEESDGGKGLIITAHIDYVLCLRELFPLVTRHRIPPEVPLNDHLLD